MTKSLLETNLDSVQEIRELPVGRYTGRIISTKFDTTKNEAERISLGVKVTAPVTEIDLSGVNLNRYVYKTIIVSEASFPYVKKELMEAGVELSGASLKEAISSLEGAEIEFSVKANKYMADLNGRYSPEVGNFKLAS